MTLVCVNWLKWLMLGKLSNKEITIIVNDRTATVTDANKISIVLIFSNLIDIAIAISQYTTTTTTGDGNNNALMNILIIECLNLLPIIILTTIKCLLPEYTSSYKWIYIGDYISSLINFIMIVIFITVFSYNQYSFPFFILPSTYLSLKSLIMKTRQIINYKKKEIILNKLRIPNQQQQDRCVICHDNLVTNVIQMKHCNHQFHYGCLNLWIDYNMSCPTCRKSID